MRARLSFGAGFLVVFLGMLLFLKMHVMLPSGKGVVECPLWRNYGSEIYKAFTPHNLGPATSNGFGFGETLFFHLLILFLLAAYSSGRLD